VARGSRREISLWKRQQTSFRGWLLEEPIVFDAASYLGLRRCGGIGYAAVDAAASISSLTTKKSSGQHG